MIDSLLRVHLSELNDALQGADCMDPLHAHAERIAELFLVRYPISPRDDRAADQLFRYQGFYGTLNWQSQLDPDEFVWFDVDALSAHRFHYLGIDCSDVSRV